MSDFTGEQSNDETTPASSGPEAKPFVYEPKTEDEIKKLAAATFGQQIFWSTMVADESLIPAIFMPLMFMDGDTINKLIAINAIPYEYLNKAGERLVNGYPIFISIQFVSAADYNRVVEKLKVIESAIDAA